MKRLLLILLVLSLKAGAQNSKATTTDTTVTFKVSGACDMCKNRIEETVKIKSVRSANWSVDTKMLTVIFNPSILSLSKIHKKLAGVGHDTEIEKRKTRSINNYPPVAITANWMKSQKTGRKMPFLSPALIH
ncbi:MAG: cation transporter [Chitinophagaceae bacterium]|nr:cation transporter [Chitinophagaceae bacterium]